MTKKIACFTVATALVLGSILSAVEVFALAQVYPAKVNLKGAVQGSSPSGAVILKDKIDDEDLHNLILGRPVGTRIPDNEVLALAVDCENDLMALIVYNTNNSAILAIVAEFDIEETATKGTSALFITEMNMESGGNDSNAIDRGDLVLAGKATLSVPSDPDCFVRMKAKGLGVISVVIEGLEIDVLVIKAVVRTKGESIGTADLDGF